MQRQLPIPGPRMIALEYDASESTDWITLNAAHSLGEEAAKRLIGSTPEDDPLRGLSLEPLKFPPNSTGPDSSKWILKSP